LLKKN